MRESRWTQHFLVVEKNVLPVSLFAEVVCPDFVRWLREKRAREAALTVPSDSINSPVFPGNRTNELAGCPELVLPLGPGNVPG
jgi:hypothetical protein